MRKNMSLLYTLKPDIMFRCSKRKRTYCWKIQPCINNINNRNSRGLNKLLQCCGLICMAIRRPDHQPGIRSKESGCFCSPS